MLGLALWGLLAFGALAECIVDTGGEAHGAAHGTTNHAHGEAVHDEAVHGESKVMGPAGHQCHHNAGHQHKNAADTVYVAPRRAVDQVDTPIPPASAGWSAASALVLLGLQRRGPPSPVSRSSPSGRHILILECVART